MTTKCSEDKCQRPVSQDKDKCVLHYVKNMSLNHYKGFLPEQRAFCSALLDYIVEQLFNDGIDVIENLSFSNSNFKAIFISEYCKFTSQEDQKKYLKKMILENIQDRVTLKYPICLENIHFPRVDVQGSNYRCILNFMDDIVFDTCEFYGTSLGDIDGKVFFQDCKFWNEWQLQDFNIRKSDPGYVYDNGHFKGKISQTEGIVSNSQFNELCTFDKGLEFKNVEIKANVFWINSEPEQDVSYFGVMKGNFKFIDCIFSSDQEIFLADAKEARFLLERCRFDKKFKIRGLEYTKGYEYQQKHKAALESLTFTSCKVAKDEDSYLRIGFLKDCEFSLKNLKNQQSSELNIGDCHFTSFKLTNFRNLGKFKLFKINIWEGEVGSEFKIDNTSIGNTDFQSLDLTSFSKVSMFDNIFSEIDYTNVQWPKTVHVEQFQKEDDGGIVKKRDTYRTLKNVALKNNDRPQALEFYAQEMKFHYQATKWGSQFGDKLTLFFNKVTNGFGTVWWVPLIWLAIASLVLYAVLVSSLLNSYGGFIENYWNWEGYWIFLNPMHKTEFIGKGYWNGRVYFIDLFFRLIQALLLYQTIQAFRKFSRPL